MEAWGPAPTGPAGLTSVPLSLSALSFSRAELPSAGLDPGGSVSFRVLSLFFLLLSSSGSNSSSIATASPSSLPSSRYPSPSPSSTSSSSSSSSLFFSFSVEDFHSYLSLLSLDSLESFVSFLLFLLLSFLSRLLFTRLGPRRGHSALLVSSLFVACSLFILGTSGSGPSAVASR